MISYAPNPLPYSEKTSLFLAGSIEMGEAEDWQEKCCNKLSAKYLIFNPRRKDWNSSWDEKSPELYQQIIWEQIRMSHADIVLFYFDPKTKSPITLLELGQCLATNGKQILVVCPDGYWRKANVVVTCNLADIPVLNTLEEAISILEK